MITEPKIERRKKQHHVAIRMAVPIPFGKYLQPAWDEVYDWMTSKKIKPSGPAIIRYLTRDMSKELDIDVGFTVEKAVKGDDRITRNFCRPAVTQRFSTPDRTKVKGFLKPLLPCSNGQRKTKSNGISQGKKASSGGMAGQSFISRIRRLRRIHRRSKRN